MSAQCQHGLLRYECPKCDSARKKREAGMDYDELMRRLRSGCAPDVCLDERDEAADAILALRADRDSQQRGCIKAMVDLAAARADAERYRWVRSAERNSIERGELSERAEESMDAYIDAALAEGKVRP